MFQILLTNDKEEYEKFNQINFNAFVTEFISPEYTIEYIREVIEKII